VSSVQETSAALATVGETFTQRARFSADESDRLWLVDLWLLAEAAPAAALSAQLELAKRVCRELLGTLEREVLPSAAADALVTASSFSSLLSALNLR